MLDIKHFRNGVSLLALASLFFVGVTTASAATYQAQTSASGNLACIDLTGVTPGYAGLIGDNLYAGVYPSTASLQASGATSMTYSVYCGFDMTGRSSGDYWIRIVQLTGSDTYWGQFNWNGSVITPVIVPNEELLENSIDEINNTKLNTAVFTATSGALTANVGYYIDTSEFFGQNDRPDTMFITVYESDNSVFEQKQKIILPLSTGNATTTLNFNTTIPDGSYFATVNFWNFTNEEIVIPRVFITKEFTVSGGVVTGQTTTAISNALLPRNITRDEPCGLTSISGCINNSFRLLFYPSESALAGVSAVNEKISGKFPFAYAYDFAEQVDTLYSTSPTESATIEIPFGTFGNLTLLSAELLEDVPFAPFIRTTLGYLIWCLFAFAMYRRTLTIFNNNPV